MSIYIVTTDEVKSRLSELIREAEEGQDVIVTPLLEALDAGEGTNHR